LASFAVKSLAFSMFVLLLAMPAWAAISRPANHFCAASGTSCTLGAVNGGDLIVCQGYRSGSTTAPALPNNNTNLLTKATTTGGTPGVERIWWRWAAGSSDTGSGTSTNATTVSCLAYAGASGIGGSQSNAAKTSTTVDYPAITMTDSSGASWVATFAGDSAAVPDCGSDTSTVATAGTAPAVRACDTGAGVTGHTDKTVSITSGTYVSAVVEILAAPAICSGGCPTHVQTRVWGTNDGGQTLSSMKYTLPNPVLANNGVLCGLSYETPSVTSAITDNIGTNTWTQEASCNDGSRVHKIYYSKNTAAGTQTLTVTLSAAEYNLHLACSEFYNVGDVDGTPSCTPGTTGPTIPAGAITTTQDNSLVYSYVMDEGSLCCLTAITSWVANPGFNLLPPSRHVGYATEWFAWGSHGGINPTMTANQTSPDAFGHAAIALKYAAGTGTAPTIVPRIAYQISESLNAAAYTVQFPCAGCNLIVTRTAESTAQNNITSVTDTDSNTYSKVAAPSTYPQMYYAPNATVTNNNSRTMTFNNANSGVTAIAVISGIVGADTSPLGAVATATPPDQTHIGGSSCPGISGSDMDHAPDITTTRANSLVMTVVNNGTGPECALVGAGYVFDSTWYPGQDDSSTAFLESSSGYGHIQAGSIATYDFHWNLANAAISGSSPLAAEFKSHAAASGVRKRIIVTSE
jgi:hypothetical protein